MTPEMWQQLGIVGAVLVLFTAGLVWAKPAVDQLIKRAEAAEAQRDALLVVYHEKVLPALTSSTAASERNVAVLERIIPILERNTTR